MKPFTELLLAVHNGEVDVADLSLEQQELVLEGYRTLAEELINDPAMQQLGQEILGVIELVDDPFASAIEAAENRGSTYWDLETNSLH